MLSEISNAAKRAGDLAGQMLAFARGGKYQPKVLNLNTILDQTLRLQEHSIPPRIRIEHSFEKNLWNVRADLTQLSQVIMNLCINATEAIEGQGLIQIKTRNVEIEPEPDRKDREPGEGRFVLLSVEDTVME